MSDVVNRLVEDTELKLSHVENSNVLVLGSSELLTHVFWNRFTSLIVAR